MRKRGRGQQSGKRTRKEVGQRGGKVGEGQEEIGGGRAVFKKRVRLQKKGR